jgi:hypothetical protein
MKGEAAAKRPRITITILGKGKGDAGAQIKDLASRGRSRSLRN